MFKGGRDFRLIAFSSPQIQSTIDVINYLPYQDLSEPEEIFVSDSEFSFSHLFYYREDPINPAHEGLEEIIVDRNGDKVYRYNMYIGSIVVNESLICIIAVPFTIMAIELFQFFNKAIRGHNNLYVKVNIGSVIAAVKNGQSLDGDIKLTRLDLEIEGDSPAKTAVLGGTDVPNSLTFDCIISSLKDLEIRYRKCKITYDNKTGKKIVIDVDRFGNYSIPLHSNGKNLPNLLTVFNYLYDINGIVEDSILPSTRNLQDEG